MTHQPWREVQSSSYNTSVRLSCGHRIVYEGIVRFTPYAIPCPECPKIKKGKHKNDSPIASS